MYDIVSKVSPTRASAALSHRRGGVDPRPFTGGHKALPYDEQGWAGMQEADFHAHGRATRAWGIALLFGSMAANKMIDRPIGSRISKAQTGVWAGKGSSIKFPREGYVSCYHCI